MMFVSITELIWQAKTWQKFQTGSGKSEVGRFSTHSLLNIQWDFGQLALTKASTRCQKSLEAFLMLLLWIGGEWEGNESEVYQELTSWQCAVTWKFTCVPLLFYRQRNSPVGTLLKIYVKNILEIPYIAWHVSTTCNGTFRVCLEARASWRWITGLNTLTTSGYLDINYGLYGTNQ